ncbi:MAG: hypothetical protein ACI837_002941 [Crocinitomicaceae bacterium]|jgi:hypothetical protein
MTYPLRIDYIYALMLIFYSIVFFLALLLLIRFSGLNKRIGFHPWVLPIFFAIKCVIGLLFLELYIFDQPDAQANNDAGTFLFEGEILHDVFHDSPSAYFHFLTGIGESQELIEEYLMETDHWSTGDQDIVNDNKNIIRIHSLLYFISFGSSVIHMMIFCLLSLLGSTFLFIAIKSYSQLKPSIILSLLVFLPSVLFWSSGLVKESVVILGLGFFAFGLISTSTWRKRILIGIIGTFILLLFKPYILLILLPCLLVCLVYLKIKKYSLMAILILIPVCITGFVIIAPSTLQEATHFLSRKQHDFSNVGRGGMHVQADTCFYYFSPDKYAQLELNGDTVSLTNEIDAWIVRHGSLRPPEPVHLFPTDEVWIMTFENEPAYSFIEISPIDDSPLQLLINSPSALANALFRPLPIDAGSALKYPAFIETILIFGLIIWSLIRRRKLSKKEKGIILTMILFSLALALLIGWVTPVLGAIARYRIPIQLAMVIIGAILISPPERFRSKSENDDI